MPWRPAETDPKLPAENAEASRQRAAHQLPPGPRRPARARGHRGLPLPRPNRLAAGRLPRRRPLLRPQRLPDHVAAARRMGGAKPDRPAPLLAAARAAAAAGPRRRRARGARPRRDLRPPGSRPHAQRRGQLAPLLPELAPDRRQPVVLRGDGQPVAAAAPLVARDRGAVLRHLAAAARPLPRPPRPQAAAHARHRRHRRLGRADVDPLQPDAIPRASTSAPTRAPSCC